MKNNSSIEKYVTSIGTTLDRFISQRQKEFSYAKGELSQLLRDIALAAKVVNLQITRSGLLGVEGLAGDQNVQGEDQQKLDVIADVRFIRALTRGEEVCAIISEEDEGMIDTGNHDGKYIVAMDPLDGSSNIDCNIPVGTIFAIYRRKSPVGTPPTIEDVMQKGSQQAAGGYVMYGSSCMLVYTTGFGVNGFTYEYSLGEFILSYPNIRIPEDSNIYSINEGYTNQYTQGVKDFLAMCHEKKWKGRYTGSMVADFHRTLLKGGIFLYPSSKDAPNGKLRLLYECNPLSYVMEQAGGMAHNGIQRILEIEPRDLHQRAPLVMGSPRMVEKLMQAIYKYANTAETK